MTRLRALILALTTAAAPALADAQLAPDARWYTFDTPHYQVHYQEGLEQTARRAAARAEAARVRLTAEFLPGPSGKVHLVVADNLDYSNGLAYVFPRNRVIIYAHGPAEEPSLSYSHEWTELVVTHEIAHIHHLDFAEGPLGNLRRIFGRNPILFPNATVPRWTTEGLATYLESRITGAGRVEGTFHDMVLRTAVLEDRFFSIDRVTAGPARWPAGNSAYVYGSMFLQYLGERFGHERAGWFVRRVGRQVVPYFLDDKSRGAYGVSFSRAWDDWRDSLRTEYTALADSLRAIGVTEPEVLTEAGHFTHFPRYSPDGTRIAYATATGRNDPATRLILPDGRTRHLRARTSIGPTSWTPDGGSVVTSQLELIDPYRVFSDVYRVDLRGDADRLTRAARLSEPDVRRDGRMVAVRGGGPWNALVVTDAEGRVVRTLADSAQGVNWAAPRWSPDGTRVAAARATTGGEYDVVVLDSAGREMRALTRDRALDGNPAWSPDGRYVVFSSDRTGIPNLFAYDLQRDRLMRVTNVLTGASQPDVSPDGRWIAFAWYRSDGYHIARIPFDPGTWAPAPPVRAEAAEPAPDPARYAETAGGPSRPYSSWRTLPPTAWSPLWMQRDELGTGYGASVAGSDVIDRHAYAASATVYERGRTEAFGAYTYTGLGRPVLGASAFQEWDVAIRAGAWSRPDGTPIASALLERERSASLVATFPRPRFRSLWWASTGVNLRKREFALADPDSAPGVVVPELVPDVGAVLTLGRSTVRQFDFSVTPEEGWLTALTVEGRRYTRGLGDDTEPRGYVRVAGRTQGYRPFPLGGFARHVIAGRVLAAADVGSRSPGFAIGGLYGGGFAAPLSTGLALGGELDFPVRGYLEGSQLGDRAVSGSLEYRFPIALVERGYRLIPLALDRVWGTAFADGGAAWCLDDCPGSLAPSREARPIYSVGAELGMDLRIFYHAGAQLMGGVAFPLSEVGTGVGRARPDPELYLRFGRSF